MSTTEVSTTEARQASAPLPEQVTARLEALLANCPRVADGPGYADMIAGLVNAETLEEAAAYASNRTESIESTKDVADVPLMIAGFTLRDSEYAEPGSLPVYATVEATEVGGKFAGRPRNFNSGALQVVALLANAHEKGWFPFLGHVHGDVIRKTGRTVYSLKID